MIFSHQRNETKLLIFSSPSQGPATDSGQDWKQKQPWCRWTYEMKHIETGWFLKPSSVHAKKHGFFTGISSKMANEEPTSHQSCLYLDACLVPSDECWSKTWKEIPLSRWTPQKMTNHLEMPTWKDPWKNHLTPMYGNIGGGLSLGLPPYIYIYHISIYIPYGSGSSLWWKASGNLCLQWTTPIEHKDFPLDMRITRGTEEQWIVRQ